MRKLVYMVRYSKRCDVYTNPGDAYKRRDFLRSSGIPTAYCDNRALNKDELESLIGRALRANEWDEYYTAFGEQDP